MVLPSVPEHWKGQIDIMQRLQTGLTLSAMASARFSDTHPAHNLDPRIGYIWDKLQRSGMQMQGVV